MRLKFFSLLLVLTGILSSCGGNEPRLVIFTYDGLRWQELYTGADSSLVGNPRYVDNPDVMLYNFE